jgi:hypothetical protein
MITWPPSSDGLLHGDALRALGPGTPDQDAYPRLKALRIESAFAPQAVHDVDMAACCLAGLWLRHDYFDESHKISQDIDTSSGSFWHGILHRREPDPSNAAYWFRRVGQHPIYEALAKDAAALGLEQQSTSWNPFDFIDWCEQHRDTGTAQEMLLRRVQAREWELLFTWCFDQAIGGKPNN